MRKTNFITLFTAIIFAICASNAFAYTISGSVKDTAGVAINGASVSLLKKGKSTTTDQAGLFSIHEEENTGLNYWQNSLGYVSIKSGMLSVIQSNSNPVKIELFDLMGNKLFSKVLTGSNSKVYQADISKAFHAQGKYSIRISDESRQNPYS